jgi:regulator of replication initiation timing
MIQKILGFLKKIPLWGWIVGIVAILFIVNMASGSVYSKKLWNMLADQIREDQSRVVSNLEDTLAQREKEIGKIYTEIDKIKKEKVSLQAETSKLKGLLNEKDAEILKLKKERESIVVPGDIDSLVDTLHKMGYGSAHKRSVR